MALCNIGKTVLDAVTLCYEGNETLIAHLSAIKEFKNYERFKLIRIKGKSFKHHFIVIDINDIEIGELYFSHYADFINKVEELENAQYREEFEVLAENKSQNYIFYRFANRTLYSKIDMRDSLALPELFNMKFDHFTRLDIAKDFKGNITSKLKSLMKSNSIATIINDKHIKDHKQIIDTVKEYRDVTLDKTINPELVFMQKNAVKNKNNGLVVVTYNKLAEINNKQKNNPNYKKYILNYYDNPQRSLHRLEVRVNSRNITNYLKDNFIKPSEEILFDNSILDNMYLEFISRVVRFTRLDDRGYKRNNVPLEDICTLTISKLKSSYKLK